MCFNALKPLSSCEHVRVLCNDWLDVVVNHGVELAIGCGLAVLGDCAFAPGCGVVSTRIRRCWMSAVGTKRKKGCGTWCDLESSNVSEPHARQRRFLRILLFCVTQ